MSTEATARKSSQVSTTVSAEKFEALEDHRWTVRKKMTEVVAEAIDDYIAKHKIQVKGGDVAAPAPAPEKGAPAKA